MAAPVTFAVIGLTWYVPATARFLVDPPGTAPAVTIAWYIVATAALAVTGVALRDRWHRRPSCARRPAPHR